MYCDGPAIGAACGHVARWPVVGVVGVVVVARCCVRCAEHVTAEEHGERLRVEVSDVAGIELRPGKVRSKVTGYWD